MELTYVKSHSTVAPVEVDLQSSPTTVFLRKNIQLVDMPDPSADDPDATVKMYEYDEAKLSQDQYLVYLTDQAAQLGNTENQVAIAELAESYEQSITDIQLSIAELAESMVE